MPTYDVVMGQAVAVRDLEGNALSTGYGETRNLLSSCSAIILINEDWSMAGLYHYPAGDITKRPWAQALLQDMAAYVQPTACHVAYGTSDQFGFTGDLEAEIGDADHPALMGFLRTLRIGMGLTASPAGSGCASVTMTNGLFEISDKRLSLTGIVKLDTYHSGVHPFGRTFGPGYVRPAPRRNRCVIL